MTPAAPPLPPPLPPGRTILLPGRGETFARVSEPAASAGLPVLLLHGWMATADLNWATTFPFLTPHVPVAAPDLRGHGRGLWSEDFSLEACADDAAALLDELGWDRAVIGGYSMGVAVAMLLARRHPDKVAHVVLGAGALHWRGALRGVLIRRGGWDATLQRVTSGRWLGRKLAARSDDDLTPYEPWIAAELERGHPGSLRQAGRALNRFDARPWAGEVRPPVTVVVTTRDRLVSPTRQRKMAEALHAPVREVPAGHEAPQRGHAAFAATFAGALLGQDSATSSGSSATSDISAA